MEHDFRRSKIAKRQPRDGAPVTGDQWQKKEMDGRNHTASGKKSLHAVTSFSKSRAFDELVKTGATIRSACMTCFASSEARRSEVQIVRAEKETFGGCRRNRVKGVTCGEACSNPRLCERAACQTPCFCKTRRFSAWFQGVSGRNHFKQALTGSVSLAQIEHVERLAVSLGRLGYDR